MTRDPLASLRAAVEACVEEGISYALIGAVARNAWARPRATTDVDLAVSVEAHELGRLLDALGHRGFRALRTVVADPADATPDLVLLENPSFEVPRVDLLIAKTPFEQEAVSRAVPMDVGVPSRVARPEHLIVYKLIAARPHDLLDAEEVLRARALAGEPADRAAIRHWAIEWGIEERAEDLFRRADEPA